MDKVLTLNDLCNKHFGLALPCEMAALKRAYRQAAKKLHTDTSGADTKSAFIEMQQAYELIAKCPGAFIGAEKEFCCTEEGTPLSDLGRGLGMKNGKPCEKCKGTGYSKRRDWRLVPRGNRAPCVSCGRLQSTFGCRQCWGHFDRQLRDFFSVCAACQGHGEIELFNPVLPKGLLAGRM